jgi:hypothetical protein
MAYKSKNILVLADTLDIEKSSGAKGRIALILGFLEAGYNLKVLHYSRKEIQITGVTTISIPEQRNNLAYFKAKSQLLFQRLTGRNINSWVEARKGFSYTHDYDVISIKTALSQENPEHFDYVLALSYASSFRAHKAVLQSKIWHSKFLAYIHDPYPMHSYPRPYDWVEPGHQYKRDFFVALYEKARYIIYPSGLLGVWMESYYPTGKGKTVIIPHLIQADLENTGSYPAYFNPTKFNVVHAGSLMSARNPMSLVRAFEQFLTQNPEAQEQARLVMVVGGSVFHNEMSSIATRLPQLILSNKQEDFQTTYNMQQQAAVNVILEAKGPASPFLPGKVPHCVAANKPILVLGPYYSETRNVLGTDYRYWSEIDNEQLITEQLSSLFKEWQAQNGKIILDMPQVAAYLSVATITNVFANLEA